jgi:hypothetical protein
MQTNVFELKIQVRKAGEGMRKRKQVGNLGKSVPETTATDAKWLDTLQEHIQEMISQHRGLRPTEMRTQDIFSVSVPDVRTEK